MYLVSLRIHSTNVATRPRHRACLLQQHCLYSWAIQAVLVSAWPSTVICSFHEPELLDLEGGASSLQLQLSGTHCCFTFAPRPSVAVSFKQGSRLIFSGCSLSLTFPLRAIEEIELNFSTGTCCSKKHT